MTSWDCMRFNQIQSDSMGFHEFNWMKSMGSNFQQDHLFPNDFVALPPSPALACRCSVVQVKLQFPVGLGLWSNRVSGVHGSCIETSGNRLFVAVCTLWCVKQELRSTHSFMRSLNELTQLPRHVFLSVCWLSQHGPTRGVAE